MPMLAREGGSARAIGNQGGSWEHRKERKGNNARGIAVNGVADRIVLTDGGMNLRIAIGLVTACILSACGPAPTLGESYAGPWQEPSPDVMVLLAKKDIRGCGEFYQKTSISNQGEYAVACTKDGRNWDGYLAWPRVDEVIGPDLTLVWKIGGPPYQPKADQQGSSTKNHSRRGDSHDRGIQPARRKPCDH